MTSSSSTNRLLASIQLHLEAVSDGLREQHENPLYSSLTCSTLANSRRWVSYIVKPPQKQGLPLLPVLFVSSRKMKQQIRKKERNYGATRTWPPTSSRAFRRAASTYGVEVRCLMTQNMGQKKKRTSLAVLWIRMCLPKQGTLVRPWSGKIPGTPRQQSPRHQY